MGLNQNKKVYLIYELKVCLQLAHAAHHTM